MNQSCWLFVFALACSDAAGVESIREADEKSTCTSSDQTALLQSRLDIGSTALTAECPDMCSGMASDMGWESTCAESEGFCSACDGCKQAATTQAPTTTTTTTTTTTSEAGAKPLECNGPLDVILLLDGSDSVGKEGWEAEIAAAKLFIGAFKEAAKVQMAVILFSGPKGNARSVGVRKCTGKNKEGVSLESCGIKTVSHYTDDLDQIDQLVTGLDWPQGTALTSLALKTAKAEMALGRADAHAIVVVFTGRPLSFRKTWLAAAYIRKAARLVWVPFTKRLPWIQVKGWATRPWQENVVWVRDFSELHKPVTHIIADICPKP
jgi:hypothetical protein